MDYDIGKGSKDVVIPSKIAGKAVTHIGDPSKLHGPFANKGLSSVTIPDTVIFISTYAFRDNELTSLKISNSASIIGDYAFSGNELTEVTIPDSVTNIGSYAFSNNQLRSVTILGTPGRIVDNAFDHDGATGSRIPAKTPGVFELIDNKWVKQ